jgi:DNA-binding NtrC family response regulator
MEVAELWTREQMKEETTGDDMHAKTRVLVVDDDEAVRLSFLRSLTSNHRKVEATWNGVDAMRAMERDPFDVVLLDLRMLGADGMTVLKTIKRKWPDSEVVIITGYPTLETAKEAVRLGAYDYLAKPLGPEDVINAADGAMQHKIRALHKDRTNQDHGSGASSGSRGQAGNQAY